ncbi:MAG: hypothetical protein IKO68_13075 [Oscillospiraceae bacterium]|nr:hypothetical protein [Oscillospiraceae bacterium]
MAILRAELQGKGSIVNQRRADGSIASSSAGVYEGIVETATDLSLPRLADFAPGSMFYCMGDKKLYIKNSACEWVVIRG